MTLKRKLDNMREELTQDIIWSPADYNAYTRLLKRAVKPYADSEGIEISGEPDKHLKSASIDIVSHARNYKYVLDEVQRL